MESFRTQLADGAAVARRLVGTQREFAIKERDEERIAFVCVHWHLDMSYE